MPTLTRHDVALLAEIAKCGGAVFDPGKDAGCIFIGLSIYTKLANAGVFVSFGHLQERQYISSGQGVVFMVTEAGKRRLLTAGW